MIWLGGDGPGESSLLGLPVSDQQTWRGGGAGRFIDNDLVLANLEVRTRVYERDLFNTHGIVELAPFVDLGRVFHDASSIPSTHLHPAGGVAFRAIALPFVIAFVDFGYGTRLRGERNRGVLRNKLPILSKKVRSPHRRTTLIPTPQSLRRLGMARPTIWP
jgi:hypothetical protein